MACGCKVIVIFGSRTEIVYCPLHKSAPILLEALKALARQEDWENEVVNPESPVGKAFAVIAEAKGKE